MGERALLLRATPALNARFVSTLLVITLLGAAAAWVIVGQLLGSTAVWASFSLTSTAAVAGCVALNSRRANDRFVVLNDDGLLIPVAHGFGRRTATVPLDELRSIELSGSGPRLELRLNVAGRLPVDIRASDVVCGCLESFQRALLAAGSRVNPELDTARRLFGQRRRLPAASLLICLTLVLVSLASRPGEDHPVHHLIVLGGLNDWLIGHGELYRLGSAVLLHADGLHLLVNLTLLLVVGLRLEYVTGPLTFAGAFAAGALAGNVSAWLWGGHTVVVGASGGVFGVLALYAHTLVTHRRHLPTRTQFAPGAYLLGALLMLFVPLPGYAQSVHVGGFAGGLLWSLGAAGTARPLLLALGAGAWGFVALSSWHGLTGARAWLEREPTLIEQMAVDPAAGVGTLDLVGWYALQHRDEALMRIATARLERLADLTPSAAGTLAELLLAQGEVLLAARRANQSFELRSDRAATDRLMRAELAAYPATCAPVSYAAPHVPPPRPSFEGGRLTFTSPQPVYVHARVHRHYLMAPAGIPVEAAVADPATVIVLGYSDRLPLRRKPRVRRVDDLPAASGCGPARVEAP